MKGQITRRVTLATAVNVYKYTYIYQFCVCRLSFFATTVVAHIEYASRKKSFRESYHVPTLAITADRRRPTAQSLPYSRVQSLFESALSRGLFLRVLLPFISGNFDCSRRISKGKISILVSSQF